MAEKIYVAIDLEGINNTTINGIGLAIRTADRLLLKKEWWLAVDYNKMDPRCKIEFWDKNPKLLQYARENEKNEGDQIRDFVKFYDSIAQSLSNFLKREIKEEDLELVSDNPEYDFGRLSPLVEKYCKDKDGKGREPLRYTTTGKYRCITDLGDAMWELGVMPIINTATETMAKHDHFPSNDAEHIIIKHIMVLRFFSLVRSRLSKELQECAMQSSSEALNTFENANQ